MEDRAEILTPLDGLDEVPWADLNHAYGSGADVPVTLRALARAGDDPERHSRLDRLDMSIYHQGGTVYSAGAAAIPFLVELAVTPGLPLRAGIVRLIGSFVTLQNRMREPWRSSEHAVTCRSALVAAHDSLTALLDDAEVAVRSAAAELVWEYALWSPRAQDAVNALAARDAVEPERALRVSLRLNGVRAVLDARMTGTASAAALTEAVQRFAAATGRDAPELELARLAVSKRLEPASVTWRDLLDAALAPTTPHEDYLAWREDGSRLARALCEMCGDDAADSLNIIRALIVHERSQVRAGALLAAGDAMLRWRSAASVLLPPVAARLDDPELDNRAMSADLLAAVGADAAAFGDRLAAALEDPYRPLAVRAAWALARQGDVRAVPALLHALDHEEEHGFGASGSYSGDFYWFTRPPLREALVACGTRHPSLLVPALRSALAQWWSQSRGGDDVPVALREGSLPRFHLLCDALAACGSAAAQALPELEALLSSTHPQLALTVIEAAGPAAQPITPRLDEVVRTSLDAAATQLTADGEPGRKRPPGMGEPWIIALHAARTRFAVTGDQSALLHTVDEVLALTASLRDRTVPDGRFPHEPLLASTLAGCLGLLGPAAGASRMSWPEQWLRANEGWWRGHDAVPIAWAHWRVTGVSDLAVQVFSHILDLGRGACYSQVQLAALRRCAEMGPVALELAPLLRQCLDRDERTTNGGGWQGIAIDDEIRQLASSILAAGS